MNDESIESLSCVESGQPILVIRPTHIIPDEAMEKIRQSIKKQLADDPRFIVVHAHLDAHYMRPGDSLKGEKQL